MEPVEMRETSDTRRMKLRSVVLLSSEIIAQFWPMKNFVHHNPLHNLEDLPFEEAVLRAGRLLGGAGYLPPATYRGWYRSGKATERQVAAVLKRKATGESVAIGNRELSHAEILRTLLLHDVEAPAGDIFAARLIRHPRKNAIEAVAARLAEGLPACARSGKPAIGTGLTLSAWCDRHLGSRLNDWINREMIKWCEAFLDEGHATWPMPGREKGFFRAWKALAQLEISPLGITGSRRKLLRLSENPEDALIENLEALAIPPEIWQNYLTLHLADLPGWAGFIKWRSNQGDYEWQQVYPADLVQFLAVKIWYERELVGQTCLRELGIEGNFKNISAGLKEERGISGPPERERLPDSSAAREAAWRLVTLSEILRIGDEELMTADLKSLIVVVEWMDRFPAEDQGAVWLRIFEEAYQEGLIAGLRTNQARLREIREEGGEDPKEVRPQAQAVFCIDVRSESLRRHLEAVGDYETYGFAGFFSVFIRFRALGSHHDTDQFPVIMKAKNAVREVPRTFQGEIMTRRRAGTKLLQAGHELLHDLKENVVTPYVTVETLGWFYALPLVGKTIFVDAYRRLTARLRSLLVPPVATSLTVEKLSREEVNEMLAAEQRSVIRRVLKERFGDRDLNLSLERLESLRLKALNEPGAGNATRRESARRNALTPAEEETFVQDLRSHYRIDPGWAFTRMERITQTGFTLNEQIFTVETALRLMGLTRNFARLVLFCGHRSLSDNNPYEAALDCGACGGNGGKPNARVLAAMANKPLVREQLAKNGIRIPQDTFFIAGEHNTTTDQVELFDLEDLPPTHLNDLLRLGRDLAEAGSLNSRERCGRFPEIRKPISPQKALRTVRNRSADWSQVRPEWGLSGNAAFVIGRRELTKGVPLDGRVFLHSYDYRLDPSGKMLELLLTAPQVVGQWINMEHYFSAVDNERYGSGSKIYHNVVGRIGIMSGPQSDLRTGLAAQTVLAGEEPYHQPLRMLTLIEATRETVGPMIRRHKLLAQYYDNEWVRLALFDPEAGEFYQYVPKDGWLEIKGESPDSQTKDQ